MAVHIEYGGSHFEFDDGTPPEQAFLYAKQLIENKPKPEVEQPRKSIMDLIQDPETTLGSKNAAELYQRGNPQSLYDAAVGTIQEGLGLEDKGKERFAAVNKRTQEGLKTTPLENAKGVLAAGADLAAGVVPMAAGIASGLTHGIVSGNPTWGLQKGKETMQEFMPSTLAGFDTSKSPVYESTMFLPSAIMDTLAYAGKGYGRIAGALGATEKLQEQIASSVEGLSLVAMMGHGVKEAYKNFKNNAPEIPKIEPNTPKEDIEKTLLDGVKQRLQDELEKSTRLHYELEQEIALGNTEPAIINYQTQIAELIKKQQEDIDNFDFATTGKKPEAIKRQEELSKIQDDLEKKQNLVSDIEKSSNGTFTKPQYDLREKLKKEISELEKKQKEHPDYVEQHPLDTKQEDGLRAVEDAQEAPSTHPSDIKPVEPIPTPTPEEIKPPEPSMQELHDTRPVTVEEHIRLALPKRLKDNSLIQNWLKAIQDDYASGKSSPLQDSFSKRVIEKFGKDFLIKTYSNFIDHLNDPKGWREKEREGRRLLEEQYGDVVPVEPKETRPTEGPVFAEGSSGLIKNIQKQIDNVLQRISKIQEQIHADEQGLLPSGSLDHGLLQKQLEHLHTEYERLSNVQQEHIIDARKEVKFDDSLPTIDPNLLEQQLKTEELIKSVEEVLNTNEKNAVDFFIRHPNLFETILNSKLHIDKELIKQDPNLVETIKSFVSELGLDLDQLFFVQTNELSKHRNKMDFSGNTGIIYLDINQMGELASKFRKQNENSNILKGLSEEAHQHYITAQILSHELGHFMLVKWLKEYNVTKDNFIGLINDLNVWARKNRVEPFSILGMSDLRKWDAYHQSLHEYFADSVSRNLMTKGAVLRRFEKPSIYNIGDQIRTLVSNMNNWLKSKGIHLNQKYIHEELVQSIIDRNKENVKNKSVEILNALEQNLIDKEILKNPDQYPFAHKTMEEIDSTTIISDNTGTTVPWHLGDKAEKPAVNLSTAAINTIGAVGKIKRDSGTGLNWLYKKGFGKTTLSNILRKHPLVLQVERSIRLAENTASSIGNKLWYGDIPKALWETKSFIQKFSKIKDPDSPYMALKQMTNEESHRIFQVFKEGFRNSFEYQKTLSLLGTHLTSIEQRYFTIFAKMFQEQYNFTAHIQQILGKKNILNKRPGWYPSVRRGDYSVAIHYGSSQTKVYQEHFATKTAADKFKKEAESANLIHFDVGDVVELSNEMKDAPRLMDLVDTLDNVLANDQFVFSQSYMQASDSLERFKERVRQRGGKLGMHHMHRSNLPGYKGDQLFKTSSELGQGFKDAIQNSVQEYTSGLRNMIIKTRTEKIIDNAPTTTHPDALSASKQMYDSALGKVPNTIEGFDKAVKNSVDSVSRYIVESFGGEFKPQGAIYDTIQSAVLSTFYLFKVLPKLSLLVTQLLSPIQAVRHMAYDGGLRASVSFGKGLFKLMSGDKELYDSLYRVSQRTNIIEPQFVEALGLKEGKETITGITTDFIKNWILLKKPTEASDILSRAITYSMMYEHYRGLGHSISNAEIRAMHGTDSTMAAYSSGETAPMFKNLGGIVGESMRPLQTYGQTQVGNFIADYKHLGKNPKTWAPMIIYGITATIMGGATTGMILSQYEAVRQLLMKISPDYKMPSLLDIIRSMPNFLNGVVEDPEAQTKLLAYGATSSLGMDIGASARVPETLPQDLATVGVSMIQGQIDVSKLFPAAFSAGSAIKGVFTLGQKALGASIDDHDLGKAITDVSPSGPIGWGLKELAGVNTTKIMGKNTDNIAFGKKHDASMERGTTELISNILGSKSTNERYTNDKNLQFAQEEKIRSDDKQHTLDMWRDTGDNKYLRRLIITHGFTEKQLNDAVGNQAWQSSVPQELRNIMTKNGTVPNTFTGNRKVLDTFRYAR